MKIRQLTQPRTILALASFVSLTSLCGIATAAETTIVEYDFENIPAYIPNWGAGYKNSYKPATGWKTPFQVSLDKTDPHSGLSCMKVAFDGESQGVMRVHSPKIDIPESLRGQTVRLEAYVRTENLAPGSLGLGIMEKDADQKTLGYVAGDANLITIDGTTTWTKVTAEAKLKSKAIAVILMFTAQPTAANATLWVDDIILLGTSPEPQPAQTQAEPLTN